jgi:shikimate kinase
MDANKMIALTGFMGSGKSRIGRELAGRLGIPFYDLDEVIEEVEKQPISEIFRTRGEEYFRKLEQRHFRILLDNEPGVLALGGGAIQQDHIRSLLKNRAVTVYLKVPLETLVNRLKNDNKRPLLHNPDGKLLDDDLLRKRISKLLEQREPLYLKADITLKVRSGWTRKQTTHELLRLLEKHDPNITASHN